MQAELIFTGTELLLGQVLNTHGQYLGSKLASLGIEVNMHTVVGDNSHNLKEVFRGALERSDIIITTGGLGPTTDDVTKETFAELLGLEIVLDEYAMNHMQSYFHNRGINVPENVIKQAYLPRGAEALRNPCGSAPGVMLEHNNRVVFMLPGPPWELKSIFEETIEPYLERLESRGNVLLSRIFKVTGIAESAVQEKLTGLNIDENAGISYIVKPGEVHVRVSAKALDKNKARALVDDAAEKVRNKLSGYIFGIDDEVLEETVGKLLLEKGLTISAAESCTGGLIGQRITDIPGSSSYFMGGIVAYDNYIKTSLLGVPEGVLEKNGAVSKETAVAMAEGVCRITGADIGIAVTGIAGPSGGCPVKPVGLVYIALACTDGTCCREFQFPGQRAAIRYGTANAALNMVRLHLLAW